MFANIYYRSKICFLFLFTIVKGEDCKNQLECLSEDIEEIVLRPFITNCTKNASEVEYWLYTPNSTVKLQPGDFIHKKNPVNILIHGWTGSKDTNSIQVVKKAYFQRYGWNHTVIIVDYGMYVGWGTSALQGYSNAYCNIPAVSANVGSFVCNLYNRHGVNLNNVHLVGFSLGGQVSGIAGKYVQKNCNKIIGRITALDPAGPGFRCASCKKYRIDSTDAKFVQIIHTNIFPYGTHLSSGDVDFFVNRGFPRQPGCYDYDFSTENITSLLDKPSLHVTSSLLRFMPLACSHLRSCFLFAESIILNDFLATSCWLGGDLPWNCIDIDKMYMGEYCTRPQKYNSYYVATKAESPYGYGPTEPLD